MPQLTVDGVRLHYQVRGDGPPLLLLHAFPLSGEAFRPQLDELSKRFRVIVPDLRGFGQSELGAGGPTEMDQFARDAFAILDAEKLDTAFIGGVSMGGYICMAMVREDAGRVRGLVLMDTQAGPDDDAAKAGREVNAQGVLREGMEFLVKSMVPKLVAPNAPQAVRDRVAELIRSNRPDGAAAALRGMALRPDSRELLNRFGAPALVIVGEHDAPTPLAKAEQIADLIRGSRLVVVGGSGHLAHLESARQVNEAISQFLETASA